MERSDKNHIFQKIVVYVFKSYRSLTFSFVHLFKIIFICSPIVMLVPYRSCSTLAIRRALETQHYNPNNPYHLRKYKNVFRQLRSHHPQQYQYWQLELEIKNKEVYDI